MQNINNMKILIVDDSSMVRKLLQQYLYEVGYSNIISAESAQEAYTILGMDGEDQSEPEIDLVLMDIVMKNIDGIEACRRIKEVEALRDIPIVVVSGSEKDKYLDKAFDAGAIDYITKPVNKIELKARVGSLLRLKRETDMRKDRELSLEIANQELERISSKDGLTGVANRRMFDITIKNEWNRMWREENPLSLILFDLDFFKYFNDHYGHQAGDDCLRQVAAAADGAFQRASDLTARYGGEEFVVILPGVEARVAEVLAEKLRIRIESLKIPHELSKAADVVTVSIGVGSIVPDKNSDTDTLIKAADDALYEAKEGGRNRVVCMPVN